MLLQAAWNSAKFLGVALSASLAILDNVGSVARVSGASMMPTLQGDRLSRPDYIWLNAFAVRNFKVNRGDVVAFSSPSDPKRILIKRIAALEGDVVQSSTYKLSHTRIRQGCMWMEGDNKEMSMDSHTFGQVPQALILGKASYVVWPPNRWGKLKSLSEHAVGTNRSRRMQMKILFFDKLQQISSSSIKNLYLASLKKSRNAICWNKSVFFKSILCPFG
jgi:mitochondrial inner membrane protease subunit 2